MKRNLRWLTLVLTFVLIFAGGGLIPCKSSAGAEGDMIYGSGSGLTRAEWLHDLVVLFDMRIEEGNEPEDYFRDVSDESEYYTDILKAVEFGVVDIPAGGEVRPDDPLTRMFAADTLSYCLGYSLNTYDSYTFSDVSAVEKPQAAQVALDQGWFTLVGGAFKPNQAVTEAEVRGMEQSARDTLAASELDPDHENTYQFADGVLVIPDTVTVVMEGDNKLVIHDTSYAKKLTAGQHFIFWMHGIPQSYIAQTVKLSGNTTVVTGRFEGEDDDAAIEDMDAQGTVDADLVQAQAADGVQLTWYEGGSAANLYANGTAYYSRNLAGDRPIKAVKFEKTFDVVRGLKATASIYLENMRVVYKTKLLERYAYFDLTGTATITGQVSADIVGMMGDDGKLLMGHIPIYGVASIDIWLVYGLDGKLTVTYTADFETGFEFDKGNRRGIFSFVKKQYTAETQVNAKLGLRMEGNVNLVVLTGTIWGETGARAKYKSKDWNDGSSPPSAAPSPPGSTPRAAIT